MNILIIGGTGILSTSVVSECVRRGYSVTMLNRGKRKAFINRDVELIKCDVNDRNQVECLLKDRIFDVVIDFLCYDERQVENSVSLFGNKAKQYVFISSAQVYNTSSNQILTEESEKPQPLWSYSVNKYIAENKVVDLCKERDIHYTIIRPGVNYDNTRIPYGIYPPMGQHWTICNRILNNKPIITWNGGQNRLNLTRSEDFARGVAGLLGNEKAYDEAFNVVGDNIYSWIDVLNALEKYLNHKVITIDIPVNFYVSNLSVDGEALLGGRSNNLICSNQKLKSVCPDFFTQFDLESGVKMTLDYYKANNYLSGYSSEYDGETDRIICKYLQDNTKDSKINLGFAPFGSMTLKKRAKEFIKYKLSRESESAIVKFISSHKQ